MLQVLPQVMGDMASVWKLSLAADTASNLMVAQAAESVPNSDTSTSSNAASSDVAAGNSSARVGSDSQPNTAGMLEEEAHTFLDLVSKLQMCWPRGWVGGG